MKYVEYPDQKESSEKEKKDQQSRSIWDGGGGGSWMIGLIWATLFLILLNQFIAPLTSRKPIIDTDYGTFIQKVGQDSVKQVVIEESQIFYMTEDKTYRTGTVDDPNLVDRLLSAGSPNDGGKIEFVKKAPKERSPILDFFLWWVLPGLLFWLIYQSIAKRMSTIGKNNEGMPGMGNFMSFGKSGAKVYAEEDLKTRFSDVAGQDEAKESLKEMVDFLNNPKKYSALGAKLPKGALLVGPPGTGKTLIARAVAGEAHVPFFSMSGSEFVQMFVGMGAAKVRDLFTEAAKKAPCIIFIDEIDAIGKSREGNLSTNDEREQTLNQLLTEMDGFEGDKGIIILAATNRPDSLDKALLRPGRFDRRIQMELPDLEGRKAIINVHLRNVKHAEIDLDVVGRATAGSSGADLANIVNEAALRAVRLGKDAVTTEDIEESVETVMAGEQRKNAVISPAEKRIIAYHEVGHAMVAAIQNNSAPVHKITIIPRTSGALGYTMQVDEGEKFLYSRDYLLNKIATLTGGRVAEEIICGTCTTGASNDIEQATNLARSMITRYGMSEKYGMMALETKGNAYLGGGSSLACSDETAADIDSEVRRMIAEAKDKAAAIITENMGRMHAVAEFLLEKETITGEEFMDILAKNG